MRREPDPTDDEALLRAAPTSSAAFGVFYARYERSVAAYFMRRARDPELAADLTSETFAAALVGVSRFSGDGPASAWLFGIARHLWLRSLDRRQVEDRARRKLGVTVALTDDVLRGFEQLAGEVSAQLLLDHLPDDQAEAVRRRVLEDAAYDEIATAMRCSESVARQRVSRGLRALRARRDTP